MTAVSDHWSVCTRGEVEHVREGEAASTAEINRLEAGLKEVSPLLVCKRQCAEDGSGSTAIDGGQDNETQFLHNQAPNCAK